MLMYQSEEKAIARAKEILEEKELSIEELWDEYQILLEHYESMLKDIKVLNRISDRQISRKKHKDDKKQGE